MNDLDSIKQNAPTVASSATLVEQSIGVWEGIRQDRKASNEVAANKHADRNAVTVRKKLLGNCAELEAVRSFRNACRKYHRETTLPWGNMGLRMLTTEQFFDYIAAVSAQQAEFFRLVDEFVVVYQQKIVDAQRKLGALFNLQDYPSTSTMRGNFHFDVEYLPLPDRGNFISDMFHQHADVLNERYQKYYQSQMENAMTDIWKRLVAPLENMSKMLNYDYGDKPTGFRDTLVSNVTDVAKLLKTCNIKDDPLMNQVHTELVSALRGVSPDTLRNSATQRLKTKEEIDEIIRKLPTLDI